MNSIATKLIPGHQIASGTATNSPYPAGSISMQVPFFKALGLDLSHCFMGTLNLNLAPKRFRWIEPEWQFELVKWIPEYPAETFWFAPCRLRVAAQVYEAWVYYPHPKTKTQHFHSNQIIEVIAPKIADIKYGAEIILEFHPEQIQLY